MNSLILSIICPIVVILIAWGSKFIYQKYYEERPKLNLQTSIELTSRKILPNKSHILTWRYECTLKNVSEYTARNISIGEITYDGTSPLFDGIVNGNKLFNEQSHLDKNEEIAFEISTAYLTKPDELMKYTIENGIKIYLPGIKIPNPEQYFRPKRLDGFYLLIKYYNSKGVPFYTLFKKTKTTKVNKYLRKEPKKKN